MKTLNLRQDTPEWHAHRNNPMAHNASEAPAAFGCSPNETRNALIRRLATGVGKEFSSYVQKRVLDKGHFNEKHGRSLAEEIIGSTLYPIIATSDDGFLSASFDGLPMDEETNWEHKSMNERLRAVLPELGVGGPEIGKLLPLDYKVQMEQQMEVAGNKRSLFTASVWNKDGTLKEARHCWYESEPELRAQVIPVWQQVDKDVAELRAQIESGTEPQPKKAPKAAPVESLPAVIVRLDGAIQMAGNLPEFAVAVRNFIERIPAEPATDAEFAICAAACKSLKEAEARLDAEEASALASIPDVEAMQRAVSDLRKLLKETRLAKEKMVEQRKVKVKEDAVTMARLALSDHIKALEKEIEPARLNLPNVDFPSAIKRMSSFDSMNNALATALANGKIAADTQARLVRTNQAKFVELAAGYEHLFPDVLALYHKATDDFANVVDARVFKHKSDEAAKEAQRKADEEARIQRAAAEAAAKAAEQARAEERAKMRREEEARQREEAEKAKREADALAAAAPAAPAVAVEHKPTAIIPRMVPGTAQRHMAPAPAPVAPQKPVLRITEENNYDEYDGTAGLTITLRTPDGKEIVMSVHDGEPEDNCLGRNFNGCYYVMEMIQAAYEAGKAGAELIIE